MRYRENCKNFEGSDALAEFSSLCFVSFNIKRFLTFSPLIKLLRNFLFLLMFSVIFIILSFLLLAIIHLIISSMHTSDHLFLSMSHRFTMKSENI